MRLHKIYCSISSCILLQITLTSTLLDIERSVKLCQFPCSDNFSFFFLSFWQKEKLPDTLEEPKELL